VELNWEAAPGQQTAFKVERATDPDVRRDWVSVGTTAAGAKSFTDSTARLGKPYYYRLFALGSSGDSDSSDIAWPPPDYSRGFTPHGLVCNRGAAVAGTALRLTDAPPGQARSAFYHMPLAVHAFATRFRFCIPAGSRAEGFTFCLQDVGPDAVGAAGGGLGYEGLRNSVAIKFDLQNNQGEGTNSTGLFTEGDGPYKKGSLDLTRSGINLHSGGVYEARLRYARRRLSLTIVDVAKTTTRFHKKFAINIPAVIGASKAHAGFTAATGGAGGQQDILSWSWTPDNRP
jgi:hypothetical protein